MQVHDACRDADVDMADAARPPLGPDHVPGPGHRSHGVFGHGRILSQISPPTDPSAHRLLHQQALSISSFFSPTTPTVNMTNPLEAAHYGAVQRAASLSPPPPPQTQLQTRPRDENSAPAPSDAQRDADEFSLSDSLATGSTSVTLSDLSYTMENGRRYQNFLRGPYPVPNDDDEMVRQMIKHMMLLELMDGELFFAPIGDNPETILDVGTGSGAWAIAMGDRFPGAHVRGVDMSPGQPALVPPNVDFRIDDCEQGEWLSYDVDFVHLRFMAVVLTDVPTVLRRAFETLRPGGWIELQEVSAEPLCDDGTMRPDDAVKEMYDLAHQAFARFGMNITLPKHLGPMLEAAGFVNVQWYVVPVPIGPWAHDDPTLQFVGLCQQEAVRMLMPVLAGRPFEALELSAATGEMALAMARMALEDTNVHRYFNYYFWYAQKPGS